MALTQITNENDLYRKVCSLQLKEDPIEVTGELYEEHMDVPAPRHEDAQGRRGGGFCKLVTAVRKKGVGICGIFLEKVRNEDYLIFENELQTVAAAIRCFRHHLEEKTMTVYTENETLATTMQPGFKEVLAW